MTRHNENECLFFFFFSFESRDTDSKELVPDIILVIFKIVWVKCRYNLGYYQLKRTVWTRTITCPWTVLTVSTKPKRQSKSSTPSFQWLPHISHLWRSVCRQYRKRASKFYHLSFGCRTFCSSTVPVVSPSR